MRDKKQLLIDCMNRTIESKELVGFNVLVLKDGKEQFYADAGYANIEQNKPFKRDTIIRLYYGKEYGVMAVRPTSGGTVMIVTLPYSEKEPET